MTRATTRSMKWWNLRVVDAVGSNTIGFWNQVHQWNKVKNDLGTQAAGPAFVRIILRAALFEEGGDFGTLIARGVKCGTNFATSTDAACTGREKKRERF